MLSKINRRDFIKISGATLGGLAVGSPAASQKSCMIPWRLRVNRR